MNLKALNDQDLEQSFLNAVKDERRKTYIVVVHLSEINRRKFFLQQGYSSLYDYLIKKMKYSSSAAQTRIEAVRLIDDVPLVASKLVSGEMNLAQVGEIQRSVKQAEKIHQVKIGKDKKAELVHKLMQQGRSVASASLRDSSVAGTSVSGSDSENAVISQPISKAQAQQLCAKMLDIPVIENQKVKTQKDGSRRMEFTFTEEQFEKFEEVRNLLAHKNLQSKRTQDVADVLETVFDQILKPVKPKGTDESSIKTNLMDAKKAAESSSGKVLEAAVTSATVTNCETAPATECVENSKNSDKQVIGNKKQTQTQTQTQTKELSLQRKNKITVTAWNSLTPKRKQMIRHQDQCCQYENPHTGKICGSRFNLQIDHIIPRKLGGSNAASNLRVLCREHNLFRNRESVFAVRSVN